MYLDTVNGVAIGPNNIKLFSG